MPFGVCHQSACATRQSAASCSAAVAGIRVSGYRAGHRRSRSGVAGRSIGGAESVDPVFHPSNGGTHANWSLVDSTRSGRVKCVCTRGPDGVSQPYREPCRCGSDPSATEKFTMPICFLDSRDSAVTNKIRQIFVGADEIYCIVAFWGRGAVDLFCEVPEETKKRIRIVCNITMGGTNPNVIEELMTTEFQIRHNPSLHSKVYWTNKGVVVGSANASANGLSMEGNEQNGWLEVALYSSRRKEIESARNYVEDVWCISKEIMPRDLENALRRWRNRRPFVPPNPDMSFIDALKQGRYTDRQRCIYIVIDVEDMSSEDRNYIDTQAEELREQYRELQGRYLGAWVNWPDIPRDEYVVSYYRGPQGGFYFTYTWKTLPENCDRQSLNGTTYQFAYRINIDEIGMTPKQRNEMTDVVRCIVNKYPEELGERFYQDGCCILMDSLLESPIDGIVDECR